MSGTAVLVRAAESRGADPAGCGVRGGRRPHPAGLDAGEITDKGYLDQRQVLARRAAPVEMRYADPVPAGVIVAGKTA